MKKLTKLQYEVIFLFSKGLTFKEIDYLLKTSSRGVYYQVFIKDKGRVSRAKVSRRKNTDKYKIKSCSYLLQVKEQNKLYKDSITWVKEKYIIPIEISKKNFRKRYLFDCINKSFKSYNKYRITILKNINKMKEKKI